MRKGCGVTRLLLIGDIHLADKPPSVRTETYTEDILEKIRWCATYANEHELDAVISLGDVFHIKSPSRNSHALVQAAAEAFTIFSGITYIVPGNHDIVADRLDSLPGQPLGTLALHPRIRLAQAYIPELKVWSIPYLDDLEEFSSQVAAVLLTEAELIVAHQSIFPPGQHPPYPHVNADVLAANWGSIPLAYGHIHDPHGFYQANGVWFCNNGAISRGSLHEETLRRHPKVTVFDSETDGCPFTSVDVPHRPAEEVFRLDEVAEQKAAEERLDEFLTRVGEVSLTSLSIESVLNDAETKLSAEAMAELRDIVQGVQ